MDIQNHVDYKTFTSAAASNGSTGDEFKFFGNTNERSAEDILNGLNSIENTLSKLSLKFRVYDIYNIQATIANQEECDIKLNALTNNTAAVINSDRQLITYIRGQQVLLTRGDVVYKDNAGDLQHIKSNSGGWYKPIPVKGREDGKEVIKNVKFKYTNSDRTDADLPFDPIGISNIYGFYKDITIRSGNNPITRELKYFVDDEGTHLPIYPLVKNYRPTATGKEEICLDDPFFTLGIDISNSKFTLNYNNMDKVSISYIIK